MRQLSGLSSFFAAFAVVWLASSCASRPDLRSADGDESAPPVTAFTDSSVVLNSADNIEAVDVSSDARTVVATRLDVEDYYWSVYNVTSGKSGREGRVSHYEFDAAGVAFYGNTSRVAAITHEGRVAIWDVSSGKLVWKHDGPKTNLYGLAVAPRGLIATCGADGGITLFDPNKGGLDSVVARWKAHDGECRALSFDQGGERLFSAGWDKTVAVWKTDGNLIRRIAVGNYANDLSLNRDGRLVAVATSAERPVLNFEVYKRIEKGDPGNADPGNGVYIFDAETGQPVMFRAGERGPVTAVAITPDGRYVASGGWDFTVRLARVKGAALVDEKKYNRHIRKLRFSADGRSLVVGNWTRPFKGQPSLTVHRLTFGKNEKKEWRSPPAL